MTRTENLSTSQRPTQAPASQNLQGEGSAQDAIRLRAHAIFEGRLRTGAPGDPVSDWLQAEQELRDRRATRRKP